jgi:carbon storage regulator
MLVLTRKSKEAIKLGDNITITIIEVKGNHVQLGIEASSEVKVYRKELYDKIKLNNILSSRSSVNEFNTIKEELS